MVGGGGGVEKKTDKMSSLDIWIKIFSPQSLS
jgi:hypothetical protein